MPQYVGQGGSITLRVNYQAGDGSLVDPTTPLVTIYRPDNTIEEGPVAPTRESTGVYSYVFAVDTDDPLGDWRATFTGGIYGNPVSGDDPFTVVAAGTVTPIYPQPLLTLGEYKTFLGINPTLTKDDARIEALIPAATRAVRTFTDRKFEQASAPAPRTFQYDGSGFLETDDFVQVTAVETDGGYTGGTTYTLDSSEYTAMPYRETSDDDPHYYLSIHSLPGSYSPEMGFERNLDTLDIPQRPVLITVTARWGWEAVPEDVKLAVAWTVQDAIAKPTSGDLQSEAIAGYARSWAQTAAGMMLAIPNRARDLLSNYARPF